MENIPNQETGLAPAMAGRQRVPRTGSRRGRAYGQGEEQHGHRAGSRCVPTHPCTQPCIHVQCSHVPGVPSSRGTQLRGHCCGCRARLQGAAGPPLLFLSGAGRKPCSREVLPYFTLRLQCCCWKGKTQFPLLSNVLIERSTLQLPNLSQSTRTWCQRGTVIARLHLVPITFRETPCYLYGNAQKQEKSSSASPWGRGFTS